MEKIFIYGYILPLIITLVWMLWYIDTYRKCGKRFASYFARDCWPILIPGVGLFATCMLLLFAIDFCFEEIGKFIKK